MCVLKYVYFVFFCSSFCDEAGCLGSIRLKIGREDSLYFFEPPLPRPVALSSLELGGEPAQPYSPVNVGYRPQLYFLVQSFYKLLERDIARDLNGLFPVHHAACLKIILMVETRGWKEVLLRW